MESVAPLAASAAAVLHAPPQSANSARREALSDAILPADESVPRAPASVDAAEARAAGHRGALLLSFPRASARLLPPVRTWPSPE